MIKNIELRVKPKYYFIFSFILASLAMWVLFALSGVLSFEKYVLLAGDSFEIYAADIKMFTRSILSGESIWYSFSTQMGMNTALSVAFKLFSPFNVLYLLFPNADINIITAIIIILKTGTSAATFQLFSMKVLKNDRISSVLFSLFYAMNSYVVIYCVINFMWIDGVYMLPIVAMGIHQAVYKKKFSLLTFSYAYIFIVQFYQGYMIGIFSLIYFVFLMVFQKKEERKGKLSSYVFRYSLSVLIAICVSAFVWLPVILFLLNHYASDSTGFEPIGVSLIQVFGNLFWGRFQDYYWSVYLYCGIPCILFLPFYFSNGKIEKKEKITYGGLLLFFMIGCIFLPLFAMLHGFDAPDMWNFRFGFIISFLLCVVGCREIDYIKQLDYKIYAFYITILLIIYLLEIKLDSVITGENLVFGLHSFWMNVFLITLWSFLFFVGERIHILKKYLPVLVLLVAFVECVTNSIYAGAWEESLIERTEYSSWERTNQLIVDRVSQTQNEELFYRMYVLSDETDNGDSFWGYNGIADFGTAENEKLRGFLKDMGLYSMIRRTSVSGITPPLETLLSVKYKARLPRNKDGDFTNEDVIVEANEYCLPIGFMVDDAALEEMTFSDNVFENQNIVFKALAGIDSLYRKVPEQNIKRDEDGLYLIGNNLQTFYKNDSGPGIIVFKIRNTVGRAFSQISYDGRPEVIRGVYVEKTGNVGLSEDCWGQIPFSAELVRIGDEQQISYYSFGDMPVAFETNGIYVYELQEDSYKELYENLSKEIITVSTANNGHIKGHIKVESNRRVLFTSIPNINGWDAYVDGNKTEIREVLNGTFVALIIPDSGEHDIELVYHCPGERLGILISVLGVLLLLGDYMLEQRKGKR